MLRAGLLAGVLATSGVGLWLLYVTFVVLPARDPDHVSLWRVVALGCLAYGALSAACLGLGVRGAVLRWALLTASVFAIGTGSYGVVRMLRAADGHFEGYILVMGLILVAHGLAAIAYTLRSRRSRRDAHDR
jgi:O-antigen/teichoic acid export membrane protein